MNVITELQVEEVKIQGGAKIRTAAYDTPNKALFDSLFLIGKALRWLMESRSNNMTRGIQPRDIRTLWQLWNAHKIDIDMAQGHSDAPTTGYEFTRKILLPHPAEMRRFKNMKIQRVASELHYYAHVIMGVDSADGVQIVEMVDYEVIKESQKIVEEVINTWVGTGKDLGNGKFDTGMEIPALTELGHEVPSGDLDVLEFAEGSFTAPSSGLKDAPDIAGGSPIQPGQGNN